MAAAKEKTCLQIAARFIARLFPLAAIAAGAQASNSTENRASEKSASPTESLHSQPLQLLELHQVKAPLGWYDASGDTFEGEVVVHHAVEQQTLKLYPAEVTKSQIHSLENLRGVPKALNPDLHLGKIRVEWNQFYKANPNATQAELLQKAAEIDAKYGGQFSPPVTGAN